jgi:hypothetical protein
VLTSFVLPSSVSIEKMGWTHTASDGITLSADALTITVDLYTRGTGYAPTRLHSYTGTASNDIEGYGFTETAENVLITTNTTNGNLMLIYFDVTVAGDSI